MKSVLSWKNLNGFNLPKSWNKIKKMKIILNKLCVYGEYLNMHPIIKVIFDQFKANRPTIRQGNKGPYVYDLQYRLNYLSSAELIVDGDFGPKTAAAVRSFQIRNRLRWHRRPDNLESSGLLISPFAVVTIDIYSRFSI